MKPKLNRKKPLFPFFTCTQAHKYAEFYRYLEYYNFGPYYIDDTFLPTIRIQAMEIIDCTLKSYSKPLLNTFIECSFPNRDFPAEVSWAIWVTYEEDVFNPQTGKVECAIKEDSLDDIIEKRSQSCDLKIFMDKDHAEKVLCHFKYLVNNCVLLPGYFVITEMRCVLINEWAKNDPELADFMKKKKNATFFSNGEYTVVAKIGSDPDINGNYTDTKEVLLNDLLQEYMVKILTKPV